MENNIIYKNENFIYKILFLNTAVFGDGYGGSYRFTTDLAESFTKHNVKVCFIAANVVGNKLPVELINGIHVYRYPYSNRKIPFIKGLQHIWQTRKLIKNLIKKIPFDFIWGQNPLQTIAFLSIFRIFGRPMPCLIYTVHSPWLLERISNKGKVNYIEKKIIQTIEKYIIKKASFVHWLSIAMYEKTLHTYNISIPENKVIILPGGVQSTHFSFYKSSLKSSNHLPITTFFILRRLEPRMGLINFVDACSIIADKRRDFKVVIGGKGTLKSKLEKYIIEKELSDIIELKGFIPEEELDNCYLRSDCMIVPSKELEGFGLVVLEAWARGIPVIATPIGGMKELLRRHTPELLTERIDSVSIAKKMDEFLNLSLKQRKIFSNKIKQDIKEYYWENLINLYFQKVKEILNHTNCY